MFMKICSCGVLQLFERQMFSGNFSKGQDQILKMAVALFPEVKAQRFPWNAFVAYRWGNFFLRNSCLRRDIHQEYPAAPKMLRFGRPPPWSRLLRLWCYMQVQYKYLSLAWFPGLTQRLWSKIQTILVFPPLTILLYNLWVRPGNQVFFLDYRAWWIRSSSLNLKFNVLKAQYADPTRLDLNVSKLW